MTEALVNHLFKRHVTGRAETIGTPIDVVVVSRGDGLIGSSVNTISNQH